MLSAEEIAALSRGDVYELMGRLRTDLERRNRDGFPEVVRTVIAASGVLDEGDEPASVFWRTDSHDDGYFYEGTMGTLLLTSGVEVGLYVEDDDFEDWLTWFSAERRHIGHDSVLHLNLGTGEVTHADTRDFPGLF